MYYICGLWPLWNTTSLFLTQRSPLWTSAASSLIGHWLLLPLRRGRGRGGDDRLIVLLILGAFFHNLILFFLDDGLAVLLGVRAVGH
jgi:hypothetical protein